MARQTVFPGIWVESMEVKGQAPPDRGFVVEGYSRPDEGIMEEAVSRGVAKEFEALQRAAEFSADTVGAFINEAENQVGPFIDEFRLTYNLKVRTTPPIRKSAVSMITRGIKVRGVALRSRAFVRVKNPFEPEVIDVSNIDKDEELSSDEDPFDIYSATVEVTK
jgi:hypothetical protein